MFLINFKLKELSVNAKSWRTVKGSPKLVVLGNKLKFFCKINHYSHFFEKIQVFEDKNKNLIVVGTVSIYSTNQSRCEISLNYGMILKCWAPLRGQNSFSIDVSLLSQVKKYCASPKLLLKSFLVFLNKKLLWISNLVGHPIFKGILQSVFQKKETKGYLIMNFS